MNAAELKYQVLQACPGTHFFDAKTMRFFGDTMRNFGVRSARVRTNYDDNGNYTTAAGVVVECWELYRRHAVKHGLKSSHFFNKATFKNVSGTVG